MKRLRLTAPLVASHPTVFRSFAAVLTLLGAVAADDQSPKTPEPSQSVKEAREHLSQLTVNSTGDGANRGVEVLPHPVLTYGDPARNNEAGTLWTWGKTGRPAAFLELYRPTGEGASWVHAVTLTSPELIELTAPKNHRWTPKKSHFALKDVPGSPDVSDQPIVRLRQMKEISRRFEAHEFWDPNNSRFELRLLVQPVLRYRDEGAKVTDGTVFVLAHGTNPEILIQIEADAAAQPPRWKYSLARLGSAEMHVLIDGREVWTEPRTPGVVGQPVDPYWLFWTPPDQTAPR